MTLALALPDRISAFLFPFYTLSYPTLKPETTDSFHNSPYYATGPLDACLILSCIVVMAILRDVTRLGIMEPFARWKLSRDFASRQACLRDDLSSGNMLSNGDPHAALANGGVIRDSKREQRRMHRSVLRFAEQGWSVIYYTIQWCYGLVRLFFFSTSSRPFFLFFKKENLGEKNIKNKK
jgi:acyl-CoA-dependent ceramide synthase